jgi:hypothetical protein
MLGFDTILKMVYFLHGRFVQKIRDEVVLCLSAQKDSWKNQPSLPFTMTNPRAGHSSIQLVVNDNTTSPPYEEISLLEEKDLTPAVALLGAPGTTKIPPTSTNENGLHDFPSSPGPSSIQIKRIEDLPSTQVRGWRFYGAFGTLCLVTFIIALDSTIICVALPVGSTPQLMP